MWVGWVGGVGWGADCGRGFGLPGTVSLDKAARGPEVRAAQGPTRDFDHLRARARATTFACARARVRTPTGSSEGFSSYGRLGWRAFERLTGRAA